MEGECIQKNIHVKLKMTKISDSRGVSTKMITDYHFMEFTPRHTPSCLCVKLGTLTGMIGEKLS